MKYVLPNYLIFLISITTPMRGLVAQDSIFAFGNIDRLARFQPRPVTDHKFETAKKVYDQLIQTRADLMLAPPTFVMNTGRRYIAWMDPEERVIGLEEQAYDICSSFGPDSLNAIAALLGHEIVHYYEKHDWRRHFIHVNPNLSTTEQLKKMQDGIKQETQADYLGGMLAITGGYNTYGIYAEFLKRAYREYGYPDTLKGYPTLDERIKISQNTADRLREIHRVYQTANLLTLIKAHSLASVYYNYIVGQYPSYEVYNNASVNAILAALDLYEPNYVPFVLPLELDQNSRLDALSTRLPDNPEEKRDALIRDAERWLKSAMLIAEQEPAAYLNQSIIYMLKQEWFDAEYYANRALRLAQAGHNPKQAADAQIAIGIIGAMQGDTATARRTFNAAKEDRPYLAQRNQQLLNAPPEKPVKKINPSKGIEKIEALFLDDFLENLPELGTTTMPDEVYCSKKEMEQSEVLFHYARDGEEYAIFHQTMPGYKGSTLLNIQLGDTKAAVLEAYGLPEQSLQLTDGSVFLYWERNILFIFDTNNRLQRWVVFRTHF